MSQLTTYMTNASADFQKSLMKPSDIYLQPNVSFMTAADFDKLEQAYQAGRKITLASLPRLLPYQLSPKIMPNIINKKYSPSTFIGS